MKTSISIIRRYYSEHAKIPWSFQCVRGYACGYPWILPIHYQGKHPEGWCECRYLMDNLWSEL